MGFTSIPDEECLFSRPGFLVLIYVDDLLLVGSDDDINNFKHSFMRSFESRDLGSVKHFLGIHVSFDRESHRASLVQDGYIDHLVSRFHVEHSPRANTPLSTEPLVPFSGDVSPSSIHLYQQKVGSILYLSVTTRPDIAFASSKLSQFLKHPGPQHHAAVDRVLCCLRDTCTLGICYDAHSTCDNSRVFLAAADASFADHPDSRSSAGYMFSLFGGLVDWKSYKQPTIALSTTEAELLSLTLAAKELRYWQRLLFCIRFDPGHHLSLQCDNSQTVRILNNDRSPITSKLRHVGISQNWLRQEVAAGRLSVNWVPSQSMLADGLTKSLPIGRHREFLRQVRLIDTAA